MVSLLPGRTDMSGYKISFREHRPGMVQTEDQYKFIYRAIEHHVNKIKLWDINGVSVSIVIPSADVRDHDDHIFWPVAVFNQIWQAVWNFWHLRVIGNCRIPWTAYALYPFGCLFILSLGLAQVFFQTGIHGHFYQCQSGPRIPNFKSKHWNSILLKTLKFKKLSNSKKNLE